MTSDPFDRSDGASWANSASGAASNPTSTTQPARRLSLRETAQLYDISPSHLSRQVRAGRPAKGHDLTDNVCLGPGGRVEGFLFAADDPLIAGTDLGEPVEGSAQAAHARAHRDDLDGIARESDEFYAGRAVCGHLQCWKEGAWAYLTEVPAENPLRIGALAERFGPGHYRISRMEGEKAVHITALVATDHERNASQEPKAAENGGKEATESGGDVGGRLRVAVRHVAPLAVRAGRRVRTHSIHDSASNEDTSSSKKTWARALLEVLVDSSPIESAPEGQSEDGEFWRRAVPGWPEDPLSLIVGEETLQITRREE